MTTPDPSIPKTDPPLLPWWLYILPVLMLIGVMLALAVYSRQGWHRAEGKATHHEVSQIATEIDDLKSEVEYLRGVAQGLQTKAERQAVRIERVESEVDNGSDTKANP